MANATLEDVDRIIFETLEGLKSEVSGGPFQAVVRYTSDTNTSPNSDKQLGQSLVGKTPALMLAWEGWATVKR